MVIQITRTKRRTDAKYVANDSIIEMGVHLSYAWDKLNGPYIILSGFRIYWLQVVWQEI